MEKIIITSRIPALMKERNIAPIDLVRAGLSVSQAYRIFVGGTNIRLYTAALMAEYFQLPLTELFRFDTESVLARRQVQDGLCPNCGRDYAANETIVDGELRCSCARHRQEHTGEV